MKLEAEELELDSDLDSDSDSDLDSEPEQNRGGILQSTSKRVRMIFSVMARPNRIDILSILHSKGPLPYSELKSLAGFKSKKRKWQICIPLEKTTKTISCCT